MGLMLSRHYDFITVGEVVAFFTTGSSLFKVSYEVYVVTWKYRPVVHVPAL